MLSAVLLVPVPATTGMRPRARSFTNFHSARRSSTEHVAASPVEPDTTRHCVPPSIRKSTRRAVAS
jgi:hypothetical protein